jgi:hypothetical protein
MFDVFLSYIGKGSARLRGLLQICITMKIKKNYFTTLVTLLTLTSVQAQYVYIDIPDTTLEFNGDYFDLDLNNDTILDFRFIQYRDTGTTGLIDHSVIIPLDSSNSRVYGRQRGFFFYADKLNVGDSISYSSNPWQGISSTDYYGTIEYRFDSISDPYSQWQEDTEGFIGLRLAKNDSLLYGWVRIKIENGEKLIIKDFAYQSELDSAIDAGHLWISMQEKHLSGYKAFISQNKLILTRPENKSSAGISIYNSVGELVVSGNWIDEKWSLPIHLFDCGLITIISESIDGVWLERIAVIH